MTLSQAIGNRDSWSDTKRDLESKKARLEDAHEDYSSSVWNNNGEFSMACGDLIIFSDRINPFGSTSEWEGNRVRDYEDKLESIVNMIYVEQGNHIMVLDKMRLKIDEFQYRIEDAISEINYWQNVIDNWDDEDD